VNSSITLGGYPDQNQWITRVDHLVFCFNTFVGAPLSIELSDHQFTDIGYYGSKNVAFHHNVFQWLSLGDSRGVSGTTSPTYAQITPGTVFDHNHFIDRWPDYLPNAGQQIGAPIGTNATTGDDIPTGVGAYGSGNPPWLGSQ
jgi:hypothetical protein